MRNLFFVLFGSLLIACQTIDRPDQAPTSYVDPFIGTGGHGHTYPGATVPFGMVQLSPDTRLSGWDGCGGYHYSDSMIYGFSHTHLQGTGISDYGDILIMPTNNTVHQGATWGERYRSAFQKSSETASPGYYSVELEDHHLTAELTATRRVGIHRYRFHDPDSCVVFIDMAHRDELIAYQIEPVNDTLIVGFRQSKEWAEDQLVYFAMAFDHPFEWLDQTFDYFYEEDPATGELVEYTAYVPVFPLKFGVIDTLQVKTGLAVTSIDAAIENLTTEAPHWDFDAYHLEAESEWNQALSKIEVESSNEDDLTNFYTALYHSLTVPNTFSDVNGQYRSTDLTVHDADDHQQYTVFSLWDTYRATHPLYTIIERERTRDFIRSFLDMYKHGGKLPMWELAGNYTHCMIGYHAVPVIVDAYRKGITDFDQQLALEAMVAAADFNEFGKKEYDLHGYLTSEVEHESVSKTMEYAYNDWCISEFARMINGDDDPTYLRFRRRALSYRNLFDQETGFIRPKRGGVFIEGFDPREVNFNYTEANGWQYNFYTPQDINGHIRLLGGDQAYVAKLDSMFFGNSQLLGRTQADITGLIGQYAHGNEPSHHMAYLYAYAGQAYKTQMLVDSIMDHLYTPTPDGLSGNEDCGQMSSWYVLSALGFYPVTPGSEVYVFGTPRFSKSRIQLENGKEFHIIAKGLSKGPYVASVELNGVPYTKSYLLHSDIMQGGELTFFMSASPVETYGAAKVDRPESRVTDDRFFPVPVIKAPRTFRDSATIEISNFEDQASIYYRTTTLDGEQSDWFTYTVPFTISNSLVIESYAESGRRYSKQVRCESKKITHEYTITIGTEYDNQYAAGGDHALIDGIVGLHNYKTGEWQGYFGKDVSFIIDLKEVKTITQVSVGALQDVKPWIWLPPYVTILVSSDGVTWKKLDTIEHLVSDEDYVPQSFRFISNKVSIARYVKVEAPSYGTIPSWHLGNGNPSWLFFDEIDIQTK